MIPRSRCACCTKQRRDGCDKIEITHIDTCSQHTFPVSHVRLAPCWDVATPSVVLVEKMGGDDHGCDVHAHAVVQCAHITSCSAGSACAYTAETDASCTKCGL